MRQGAIHLSYLMVLILTACSESPLNISVLRSIQIPAASVTIDALYTNNQSTSPNIHISKSQDKYQGLLSHYEYKVLKDGLDQSDWISIGSSNDISVPYQYSSDGEYHVAFRALSIDGLVTNLGTTSFFVDTIRPSINLQPQPWTDKTQPPAYILGTYESPETSEGTMVNVQLIDQSGTVIDSKTYKLNETTDFVLTLLPTGYSFLIYYVDRAGNTAETLVGFAGCDNVTVICQ